LRGAKVGTDFGMTDFFFSRKSRMSDENSPRKKRKIKNWRPKWGRGRKGREKWGRG
jgi:hypothetical protein